jgi:hypothetical protein
MAWTPLIVQETAMRSAAAGLSLDNVRREPPYYAKQQSDYTAGAGGLSISLLPAPLMLLLIGL